jgi:cellulose synthase/poly-beta-1,6-N-acetylglucosamine synthase-like glycosyltransferase
VRNFADLQVGCVSGTYRFGRPPSSVRSAGEQHYFRYETAIREWESRWHSTLGAHGAGYAIRSVLFPSIPRTIINDDFVIPAKIIAAGYRAVYEKEAIVYEQTEATITQEFSRRVRIAAGNFQQLALLPELLRRRCFSAAFAFFSHKVLRTLLPFLLLICFVASWLIEGQFYRTAALFQLAFYSMGLLGALRQGVPRLRRWLTVPSYFVLGNLASVVGFYNFCRHPHHIDWGGRRDRDS